MIGRRLTWILVPTALALSSAALAADPARSPAATSEEIQQLQKQLEQMNQELAAMKKIVESGDIPAQRRTAMMSHMGRMENQMHGMMSRCCSMDAESCPEHMR